MAFYPTKLENQYTNPSINPTMLDEVVRKCHAAGIRVITRFDFSRAHRSIFERHPDWFYISPDGERIINDDMYAISINAPYEQVELFNIVSEVIGLYPIDGIFLNMPGYQTRNPYIGKYYGIDQNPYDKKRYKEFSGSPLPLKEDFSDPNYRRYVEFRQYTTEDLMRRLDSTVKAKNPHIAVCTYSDRHVDIIRHESQTNTLPYWPYNASDNVNNTRTSFPNHIVSNASMQQISFQSRYNAIEPEEVSIRLYENLAQGSGLDMSLMGDFQDYEDERNYHVYRDVYAFHKTHEKYFGRYTSAAEVLIVSAGSWPSGETGQEYRGLQLMLKEAHIQHDLVEDSQLVPLGKTVLQKYKVIILPDVLRLGEQTTVLLRELLNSGTSLIATNRTLSDHPSALMDLFGAKAEVVDHDGAGYYLNPSDTAVFKRFDAQKLLHWKFNLGLYTFPEADTFLNILTPGRPGPPERIGGHAPTRYYALGVKGYATSKAALLPGNIGRLYYLHGYEQNKNVLLDVLTYVYPGLLDKVITNAHPRIEVVVQQYRENLPQNLSRTDQDGLIVHLVNLTGFSGNTYFEPHVARKVKFDVEIGFSPSAVYALKTGQPLRFQARDGRIQFEVDQLREYEGIVIEK
jgi:hypothetical protein